MKKIIFGSLLLMSNFIYGQESLHQIKVSGAMRNVIRLGDLSNTIYLDTIQNKLHLYGLGPYEKLKGEILVIDGRSYTSKVGDGDTIVVEETFDVKAPFFVYGNNADWRKLQLPNHVMDLATLEAFISEQTKHLTQPFIFKLEGIFENVVFHIQNLPEETVIKSMKDAHTGQKKYKRLKQSGTIVGFYSQHHQTIFTHHDSYIHTHFINDDRTEMGHIDELSFDASQKVYIYLPK